MDIKTLLKGMLLSFFPIFGVGILTARAYILVFTEYTTLVVSMIDQMLLMTALISLAHFIMYSKKELPVRQMIVRHVLHFVAVMAIVLGFFIFWDWIYWVEPVRGIILNVTAVVVWYALIKFANLYYMGYLAKAASKRLKERYPQDS